MGVSIFKRKLGVLTTILRPNQTCCNTKLHTTAFIYTPKPSRDTVHNAAEFYFILFTNLDRKLKLPNEWNIDDTFNGL